MPILDLRLVGPEGYPVILDRTKIIAVHETRSTRSGDAQCVIYLEGIGAGFQVEGLIEEIEAQVREAEYTYPKEEELQPGNEALLIFGKPTVPDPNVWRNMSSEAHDEWERRAFLSGGFGFRCLLCKRPTESECTLDCESCRPGKDSPS